MAVGPLRVRASALIRARFALRTASRPPSTSLAREIALI